MKLNQGDLVVVKNKTGNMRGLVVVFKDMTLADSADFDELIANGSFKRVDYKELIL